MVNIMERLKKSKSILLGLAIGGVIANIYGRPGLIVSLIPLILLIIIEAPERYKNEKTNTKRKNK